MPSKIKDDILNTLGDMLETDEVQFNDTHGRVQSWSPSLSSTQQEIFDCSSKFVLTYGNRGSGKTFGLGHKLVRHCYEERNALAVIIVGIRSQATQGGIWDKLDLEILPAWKEGIDLEYTEEKRDVQNYNYRMVKNRHGGWSKVVLLSMPWGQHIGGRIRGFEPSFVLVDELTTLGSSVYFDAVIQQIGRRPGIQGPQQYCAATNPDGPSHWVYKRFFEVPWEESVDENGEVISAEGEWDTRYANFHLQAEENKDNLNPDYYQSVVEATRNDPIEYRRMVKGEWVDRPLGDSIFVNHFDAEVHMIEGKNGKRLIPISRFPVVLGYDLGQTSNAIVFMQPIRTRSRGVIWIVFDEIVFTNKKMSYEVLTRVILRRMAMWEKLCKMPLQWHHVSDNSAFNQFRPGEGSYDCLQIQKYSQEMAHEFNVKPIKMVPAPKFQGSVEARVRITMQGLSDERLLISGHCDRVKQMFMGLQSQNVKEGTYDPTAAFKPKRSVHLHSFDAMSYVLLEADLGRPKFLPHNLTKVEIYGKAS